MALDAKKQFVRYISHEVRTPLNIVLMALTLHNQYLQLIKLKALQQLSWTELLKDVEDAISTSVDITQSSQNAVDVLNDILLYDKIENGHIVLDKQYISVGESFFAWVKPFEIQVIHGYHSY